MQKKFVGAIAFLDSKKDDRLTNIMSFDVMCEWFASVKEFHTQSVMQGDYDGSEILVTVYEYDGYRDVYERPNFWNYDTKVVGTLSIKNTYFV